MKGRLSLWRSRSVSYMRLILMLSEPTCRIDLEFITGKETTWENYSRKQDLTWPSKFRINLISVKIMRIDWTRSRLSTRENTSNSRICWCKEESKLKIRPLNSQQHSSSTRIHFKKKVKPKKNWWIRSILSPNKSKTKINNSRLWT